MNPLLESIQARLPREITCRSHVQMSAALDIGGMTLAGGVVAPHGAKLEPDPTKAYIEFRLAHAFPVVSAYRTSLHPTTVRNSYMSMLNQQFNYGHLVREYHKESDKDIREDRILGAIVAVDFPREPMGGFTLTNSDDAPGMRCVATIAKQAKGMDRVLGQYQTGRKDQTVSLELEYILADSGVVLVPAAQGSLVGKEREDALTDNDRTMLAKFTPPDYARAGLGYVPLAAAPDDLFRCFDLQTGMWSKPYKGNNLVTLMGGIDGSVHFKGTGLVNYGAEPAARIETLLAEDKGMAALAASIAKLDALHKKLPGLLNLSSV